MKLIKILFLSFLLAIAIFSFVNLYQNQSLLSYLFSFAILLPFVALGAYLLFDVRIRTKLSTKLISIEQSISRMNTRQQELEKLTQQLLRISILYTEGAGYLGDTPAEYQQEIDKSLESLSTYLPSNFINNIKEEIKQLNNKNST